MQNILSKSTQADRGFINRPVLTPHLQYRILEDQQILLVSEFFNTLIKGRLYCILLPLLDGSRTLDEIIAELEDQYSNSDVLGTVYSLSARGYIVSAEHGFGVGQAAYWSTLGVTPRWAEQQLKSASIAIEGCESPLANHLKESGVNVVSAKARLTIVTCKNYLEGHLQELNNRFLEQNSPWILARPVGIEPMFGPVFNADGNSACWECLVSRLRCHQEVHEFLRSIAGENSAFKPGPDNSYLSESVNRLIAAEILKWIVLEDTAVIHNHVITFNTRSFETARHKVIRRPQCLSCGAKELFDPNRKPFPLQLTMKTNNGQHCGGARSVPPEVTLAKYKHLVSPISGVATWLSRTTKDTDAWLHVYWAGNNHGLKIKSLNTLRRSLRSKSSGKGTNPIQSQVSALCEAVERYSGVCMGDEIRISKSYDDFTLDKDAIHPNDVQLFSENQLNNAESINSEGHPHNWIPKKLDSGLKLDWTPVWSFTQQRHRYLPTSMLYYMIPELRKPSDFMADSNGCAAGNTLEEAILQGFYELVERDSFAIWWYNRLRMPSVDLASFDDQYLNQAQQYYKQYQRDLWMLDITSDICIPTFVAISHRPDGQTEDIIYGAGAHHDPKTAALRALCELNQCLSWLPRPGGNDGNPSIDDPMALSWWKNTLLKDCPWLVPATDSPPSTLTAPFNQLNFPDMKQEVEHCQSLVEEKGMEFLVLDQTRPDIGLNVVRVIVPGMRHFWARLGPGRLYDAPVSMGYHKIPLTEFEMNKVPVIA